MLSCLAKENDNYLVANMGDLQPCNDMVSSSCRPMTEGEAYFHYNTDVAFYPQGQLISRYPIMALQVMFIHMITIIIQFRIYFVY